MPFDSYLPLDACQLGYIYRLHSRNLAFGAFDGDRGFLGIRTKFGERFLDTEYHWDHPPFPTAKPLEAVAKVPEGVPISASLYTIDARTLRRLEQAFDSTTTRLSWLDAETGKVVEGAQPRGVHNKALWDLLEKVYDGYRDL